MTSPDPRPTGARRLRAEARARRRVRLAEQVLDRQLGADAAAAVVVWPERGRLLSFRTEHGTVYGRLRRGWLGGLRLSWYHRLPRRDRPWHRAWVSMRARAAAAALRRRGPAAGLR